MKFSALLTLAAASTAVVASPVNKEKRDLSEITGAVGNVTSVVGSAASGVESAAAGAAATVASTAGGLTGTAGTIVGDVENLLATIITDVEAIASAAGIDVSSILSAAGIAVNTKRDEAAEEVVARDVDEKRDVSGVVSAAGTLVLDVLAGVVKIAGDAGVSVIGSLLDLGLSL